MENFSKYARPVIFGVEESLSIIAGKIAPNSMVLDVGCCTGMLGGSWLWKKDALSTASTSITKHCNNAADISKTACKNLEHDDLTDIFVQETYDFIVVADLLEHLVNPDKLLSQLKRLVKPHGELFFPCRISLIWPRLWNCCLAILVTGKMDFWIVRIFGSTLEIVLLPS